MYVQPKERLSSYVDKNNVYYISLDPSSYDLEDWVDNMIKQYGLENLVKMYPYQPLYVDKDGIMQLDTNVKYNAKITNVFHVKYHEKLDTGELIPNAVKSINNNEISNNKIEIQPYKLKLKSLYSFEEPKKSEPMNINPNEMIYKDEDCYRFDPTKFPDYIQIDTNAISKWHPNRDTNGNYMMENSMRPTSWFGNGYYYGTYGDPYSYNPYYYQSSYIPSYKNQMPF